MADPNDNSARSMLGALWAEAGLATILVAMRYYTRIRINRVMGWDDHIMLIAMAFALAGNSMLTTSYSYGFGLHEVLLQKDDLAQALMFENIAQPLLVTGLNIARVSITIFLIRLFPTKARLRSFLIWITVANCISTVIPVILPFTCQPVQKQWRPYLEGHCPNPQIQVGFAILKAALSAFTDLATALWPITIIWSLQMRMANKIALGFIFGLSLLAMVGSIVQATYLNKLGSKSDIPYELPITFTWIGTQCFLVIMVGTIPSLRPLFQKTFHGSRPLSSDFSKSARRSKQIQKLSLQNNRLVAMFTTEGRVTNVITADDSSKRSKAEDDGAGSEEYILPTSTGRERERDAWPLPSEPSGAIHVSTDVDVAYENREHGDAHR